MDSVQIGSLVGLLLLEEIENKKTIEKRRWWTHPTLSNRLSTGQFHIMFTKHRLYPEKFFQFYRMSVSSFDELLDLVSDSIAKHDTNMRKSITPAERLAVTLRYLSSGMTFGDIEFDFHISRKTVPLIVSETCTVIWNVLQPKEMPTPSKKTWLKNAKEIQEIANFPNCVGTVDGKHIRIQCPPNTGSEFFNFKKYFSIVLMAVADANYYFTAIDVGAYGREGDSSVFKKSNFGKRLTSNQLDLPTDKPLPSTDVPTEGTPVPYVFLGDEAFGLSRNLLRPYPAKSLSYEKRIYNYRHCRARRVVECTFGLLSNKWRILHSVICVHPDFASIIIQCCCVLHNFVRKREGYIFEDTFYSDMMELDEVVSVGGRSRGIEVRDMFCDYFNRSGAVPWQGNRV